LGIVPTLHHGEQMVSLERSRSFGSSAVGEQRAPFIQAHQVLEEDIRKLVYLVNDQIAKSANSGDVFVGDIDDFLSALDVSLVESHLTSEHLRRRLLAEFSHHNDCSWVEVSNSDTCFDLIGIKRAIQPLRPALFCPASCPAS